MSGGTLSRNLVTLPAELAERIDEERSTIESMTCARLEELVDRLQRLHALVDAADRYLSGDTGVETFNFEWSSITAGGK